MKNSIFLFLCFVTFWSYSSYGFVEEFNIQELPGNPTTTNGNVSQFNAYPNWYNIAWQVDTNRCFVTKSNGKLGGTLNKFELYVVFKNIKINKTSHYIHAIGNGKSAHYSVSGFTLEMPIPTFGSGSSLNIPCYSQYFVK